MKTPHLKLSSVARLATLFAALACALATTAVFGQATYLWIGPSGGQIGNPANWTNINGTSTGAPIAGVPYPNSAAPGDTMEWSNQVAGPLSIIANTNMNGGASGSAIGLVIYMNAAQTSPVNIAFNAAGVNGTSVRTANIMIDAGAGTLSLGNTNSTTNSLYMVLGGVTGQIHEFLNNSTNPAIIYPAWRLAYGGGGSHTINFDGTGNWLVTNTLMAVNGSQTIPSKSGTGTLDWTYAYDSSVYTINSQIQGPVTVNAGTMIVRSGNLLNNVTGAQTMVNNGVLFEYAGVTNSFGSLANGTISLAISGTSPITIASGNLTLSGQNTYTGTNLLLGGELIAGSAESPTIPSGPLGEATTPTSISFQGGTLGYSAFNGFDYSPRFDTSPGQAYSIDTGGQDVTFSNALTSVGATLTKVVGGGAGGSLTLTGSNTYSGLTTVNLGKLVLAGTAGNGNITVADGAALGVVENGTAFTPGMLTLGSSTGATFEANNVTNQSAAPMVPNTLAAAGTTTVNVNSGKFRTIGQTFPLLTWTNGAPPTTSLGSLAGAGGHLKTNGNEIDLVIDLPPFLWTGASNGSWDTSTMNNWIFSGNTAVWTNNNYALFDDTLTANSSITISGVVSPITATFGNVLSNYTITSSTGNDIGGSANLTMSGSGTTTLAGGANTYTGVTTISGGGILSVGVLTNGGSASDIGAAANNASNLVFNGGRPIYTGARAAVGRLFTLGTSGGTIDNEGSGQLSLTNTGSMGFKSSGPRTLTLTGVDTTGDTLAVAVGDGGGPTALVKNGVGTWTLTGSNTYTGGTSLVAGILNVGTGGTGGTLGNGGVNNATTININRSGTLTVLGSIDGPGAVNLNGSGTTIFANNNLYAGGTTINSGTLQVGNGGGTGSLNTTGPITNNANLVFNSLGTQIYTVNGLVSGTGNVTVTGSSNSLVECIGANSYTGWTFITNGATFQPCTGNQGALVSSVISNYGVLRLVRQDTNVFIYSNSIVGSGKVQMGANNNNPGSVTLTGSNSWTGGTFIGDNILVMGDNVTNGDGAFTGNVTFTNNFTTTDDNMRMLDLFRVDNFTISGNIVTNFATPQNNRGIVQLDGNATVTLTGNNTYGGGTIVNNGTLVIGAGTTGSVGTGPVTFNAGNSNQPLVINISGTLNIPGAITCPAGPVVNIMCIGSGTVILGNSNNMALPADLDVDSGTFVSGGVGASITNSIAGNLNVGSGIVVATLNKSTPGSNTFYNVTGGITNTNGSLKLLNYGPPLQVGDTFTIFSKPVAGNTMSVTGPPGAVVSNMLALNGSVQVTVTDPLPTITTSLSSNKLTMSWPATWLGMHLQMQTNSLMVGLSNNWVSIPGTDALTSYTNTLAKTNGCTFFRLAP